MTTFLETLINRLETANAPLCVGLDSRYDRLPEEVRQGRSISEAIVAFNKGVVDVSHEYAAAFKMNLAFYAGFGTEGLKGLKETNDYIRRNHPSVPIFADCKRSEMGESVDMVRREIFDELGFNCVMVTPWFGYDTIRDYLAKPSHGVAVYVHDSNPSAYEIQDLLVVGRHSPEGRDNIPAETFAQPMAVYEYVTQKTVQDWNTNGNVIIEAGLTYPKALKRIREIAGPDVPMLVAGLGAQGGKKEDLVGLFGTNRRRLFVNVSRGIIFPTGERTWQDNIAAAVEGYANLLCEAQAA
jgi:orotidine-5'-phosphate decarboxylase